MLHVVWAFLSSQALLQACEHTHTQTHEMCWQRKRRPRNTAWNESCKSVRFPSWKWCLLTESQFCLPHRTCKENWTEGTGKWPSVRSYLMAFAFLALLIYFSSQKKNTLCCLFPCGSIVCGCLLSVHHILADQHPLKNRDTPLPRYPTSTNLLSLSQPFTLYICIAHTTVQTMDISSYSPSCLDFFFLFFLFWFVLVRFGFGVAFFCCFFQGATSS